MIQGITILLSNKIIRLNFKKGLLCLFLLSFLSCKKSESPTVVPKDSTATTTPATPVQVSFPGTTFTPGGLDTTKLFEAVPVVHNLARTDLLELSGIAASRINAGILYIHDDSGNPAQVYLTDASGNDRGTLNFNTIGNRDWEDIAVGPGPIVGKSYVYLGDIGDNKSQYSSIFVYRFPEPDLKGSTSPALINIDSVDVIELKYPNGPRNAETLMVDPHTRDIYIASKESNNSYVYVARYPQNIKAATVMMPVVHLFFNKATAGDISPDGTEILLRSNELIWYWKVQPGATISATLLTQPQVAPYANNEPQGEGIGFAADGSGYYTDTEIRGYTGKLATISFYKHK